MLSILPKITNYDSLKCYTTYTMKYQSLHNHTTTSDGLEDYLSVLNTAEKYNFDTIAFTDHDALPSKKDIENLKSYTGPVRWLAGIEMSSALPKELGGKSTSSFHIVGLFVDVFDSGLKKHCKLAQNARKDRMQKIVTNLNKLGFTITEKECLQASGGESVGRPHITKAILSHKENHELLRNIANEMKNESKNNKSVKERYDTMMSKFEERGISEYVYGLLLTDESYIKNIYVGYLYLSDMDNSVSLIRNAGGIAILAHWQTIKDKISLNDVRTYLNDNRLDGIETVNCMIEKDYENYINLEKLTEETKCIRSVGIDAHKPDDFKYFISIKESPKKTYNTLEKIIERIKPNLKFSNIKP